MKRILTILIVFTSLFAKAQTGKPSGQPAIDSRKFVEQKGYYKNDSGYINANRDTNWTPRYRGTQIFNTSDSSIYYWDSYWRKLAAGQTIVDSLAYVNTIAEMVDYTVPAKVLFNRDSTRGGSFNLINDPSLVADNGVVFPADGIGSGYYWVRQMSSSEWVNVLWFGATGDGVTDDRPAIQAAVDFVSAQSGGGTVYVPAATNYYRDTLPIYWYSNVNLVGEGSKSVIYNDRDTTTSTRAYPYVPIYFGEMLPISYDSVNLRYYNTGEILSDKIKVSSSDMDSFSVGNLIVIRGLTGFVGADGSTKPHVFRIEKIVKKISPDTLVIEHPMDTTLTTGKVAILNEFLPTAPRAIDEYGHPFYYIENIQVSGVQIKSNAEAFLRYGVYEGQFNNVEINAGSIINCNAMSWNNWTNIRGSFWTQAFEFAMGSNNSTITNLVATWKRDTFLISTVQPLGRFGENVFNIQMKNVTINAGLSQRQGIAFDEGTYNSIVGLEFYGPNIAQKLLEFTTSFYGSICTNNFIKQATFYGGNSNSYMQFNEYNPDSSINANNYIEDVRFFGGINSSFAYRADGSNNSISNSYFSEGKGTVGDYPVNFRISNTHVDGVYERLTNVTQEGNYFNSDNTKKVWTDTKNIGIGDNRIYNTGPTNNNATHNIAIGINSQNLINTGKYNVTIGYGSLENNADGDANTLIGDSTGGNYTANNMTAVGVNAFKSATTLLGTGVGAYVFENSTAINNLGFGAFAGRYTTTGARNLFLGNSNFINNTTGSDNFGFGSNVADNSLTVDKNVVFGNNNKALDSTTGESLNFFNSIYALRFNRTNGLNPSNALIGINVTNPIGFLHLPASTVDYPSLVINTGIAPTGTLSGMTALYFDGTHLYTRIGSTNYQLDQQGGGGGSGTVTSVGLSMPTGFSVGSSPVTTSGTIAVTTSLNGILYGNGSNTIAAATIGSGLSFAGGTLSANISNADTATAGLVSVGNQDLKGRKTIYNSGIGTTSTPTLILSNNGTATSTLNQWSPALEFKGSSWKTNATAAARDVNFRVENQTVTGTSNGKGNLQFSVSINGGSYSSVGGFTDIGGFYTAGASAIGTAPSTSAVLTINEATGTTAWTQGINSSITFNNTAAGTAINGQATLGTISNTSGYIGYGVQGTAQPSPSLVYTTAPLEQAGVLGKYSYRLTNAGATSFTKGVGVIAELAMGTGNQKALSGGYAFLGRISSIDANPTAKFANPAILRADSVDNNYYSGNVYGLDFVGSNYIHNLGGKARVGDATRTAPVSTFEIAGSFSLAYREATTTTSITASDYTLNCTSGTFTATLPTAVGIQGRVYQIVNSGAGTITLATTSSQTIGNASGSPTSISVTAGLTYTVQSTGANWIIL